MYNLAEQKLLKTLQPGIKWISSMDVHPLGEHLIVGGYDRKLCWFDLDLSDKPYKVLRSVLATFYGLDESQTPTPSLFLDIMLVRFDLCIFIRHTHYLPHLPMMGLFRCSMQGCTMTL